MSPGRRATVWLVRHAKAGSRLAWEGDDRLRPLSAAGADQARALAGVLEVHGLAAAAAVLSSDYVRCRQTVEPLAARLGLPVRAEPALVEGTPLGASLALVAGCGSAVLCSHGDVIGDIVTHLDAQGVALHGPRRWAKGSTWVLETADGAVLRGRYVDAPSVAGT